MAEEKKDRASAHPSSPTGSRALARWRGAPAPVAGPRADVETGQTLAREVGLETLDAVYAGWEAARQALEAGRRELDAERRRLEEQGSFLLGTVRAAQRLEGGGPARGGTELVPEDALQQYVREAEGRLQAARAALEERGREVSAGLEAALASAQAQVEAHLARAGTLTPPQVRLWLRPLGAGRTILHLERPAEDAAVLLLQLLSGQLASRYGFLRDEVTEDLSREPPTLYGEAGVAPEQAWASAPLLQALLEDGSRKVLPARGILPFLVPRPEGGRDLVRFRCRGPVLELEWAEGEGFRSVLSRAEGEQVAGHLLRLKLLGRLGLELATG